VAGGDHAERVRALVGVEQEETQVVEEEAEERGLV